jgi:hypothetical protein
MKNSFWKKIILKKSLKNLNTISRKNLYIFPNLRGFQIAALIFFCFAVAIFYQNNFALLLSIVLFFIYFISILISYQNLLNLDLSINNKLHPANKFVNLIYQINDKQNKERLNVNFDLENETTKKDINHKTTINLKYKFDQRGKVDTPTLNIHSLFPFGIIKTFTNVSFKERLTIYPEPIRPSNEIFDQLYQLNTDEGFDYEFDKIEESKENVNLSKISWKHSSIKKKLYEKKFKFSNNLQHITIDLQKISAESFEKKLSYASYLIEYFYQLKKPFLLKNKDFISAIACSLDHRNKLLTYLANA